MKNLYIYAYPAQMITFQIITSTGEKINNKDCTFNDIVQTTTEYLNKETINSVFVVGNTSFADKVVDILRNAFGYNLNIGRIENA